VACLIVTHTYGKPTIEELIMKLTQQRVLLAGLLAFSLAACSNMPWRNTSGTTPAAQPGSATPDTPAPTAGSTDSEASGTRATSGEAGGHN
jgi:hypothetical protein